MNKCMASYGLIFGTAIVVGAALVGVISRRESGADSVKVTNPLLQKILATNGWSKVRSNQLFKLLRRFDGEPSTLQLVDAHDIQNALIAGECWKGDSRFVGVEIFVGEEGVQLRHLASSREKVRTGKSPYPVWSITEEQAKWLRGWFPDDLKVEGCLFTGTKQEPRLRAIVAYFSPTQRPMRIPMDKLIPKPYNFDE